uniref:T6SS Phospholipase effector Tle1-like catalytic domain-containing protein n=1 Tax=Psilocybe cubensis TaxID=181762 RepID=A0A8H7XSL4_PSICU
MPQDQHIQEPTGVSLTDTVVVAETSPTDYRQFLEDDNSHLSPHPPRGSSPTQLHEEKRVPVRREGTIGPQRIPDVIPPEHSSRTLILCFDGTGDQFDNDNSNIVKLVSLLKKDDKTKQLVYYQTGIGTYNTAPYIASPILSQLRKALDGALALNLDSHVMSGYEFLMENYVAGDKICIFGFSRGAYTARSLAGMLHKVGLLPSGNFQQVPFAYKMYTRADDEGWQQSTEFKKAFSVDVSIEFIGVWDTVDSVGLIPKRLPFTTSNTIVRTFRHAVSLDERRAKFKANLWNRTPSSKVQNNAHCRNSTTSNTTATTTTTTKVKASLESDTATFSSGVDSEPLRPPPVIKTTPPDKQDSVDDPALSKSGILSEKITLLKTSVKKEDEDDRVLTTLERIYSEKHEKTTDVEEVWFAPGDVGGGSVSNRTRHSLARIPLRWMVRECFKANTGIMFNSAALYDIGLDPSTLYPYIVPRPPPLPIGQQHTIKSRPKSDLPIRPPASSLLGNKLSHAEITALLKQPRKPFLGSEEEEELHDILSPAYDQLKIKKAWWALEIIPLTLRYQRGDNQWVTYFGSNMARPRFIPKQKHGFKVHRSVKIRMEAEFEDEKRRKKGKKYKPRPLFNFEPIWVD